MATSKSIAYIHSFIQQAKHFYHNYVPSTDRFYLVSLLFFFIASALLHIINLLVNHYTGWAYIEPFTLVIFAPLFAFWILSLYADRMIPRIAFVIRSVCIVLLLSLTCMWVAAGIQYTPFPPIDRSIVALDQRFGIHLATLMAWTHTHSSLYNLLSTAYLSLPYFLLIIPISAFLLERKRVHIYFIALILSFAVGTGFYYFFPTMAPVSMIKSPYFLHEQHDTFLKFFEIHHRLIVTVSDGGMISFPSFHVIWATLTAYLGACRKWLLYPSFIWAFLIIMSTVLLGWHYVADLVSGIALALLSLWAGKYIYKKLERA